MAVGGDGTLNTVAQAAWQHDCPVGLLPQGTFNLFGREHGIPLDLAAAARALLRAQPEPVQAAEVNGRLFLVNASLGLYPQLLQDREAFKRQFGRHRWVALMAGLKTIFEWRRQLTLEIELDGERTVLRTPTLFVGNNRLQLDRIGMEPRIAARVGEGRLAALIARPIGTGAMVWLMLKGAFGRLGDPEQIDCLAFRTLTVRVLGRRRVRIAADGEVGVLARRRCAFRWRARPLRLLAAAARGPGAGRMSLLLHISDTHFGTEDPPVVAALQRLATTLRPDVLVFSGDITQRARSAQFAAARAFCDSLGIERLLALPGNHDIPLFNLPARLLDPYGGYRDAFGDELEPELEGDDLLLLGVNTTRPARHKNGEVSTAQVARVARRLETARREQLRVVVTHQPACVMREEDEPDRLRGGHAAIQAWSRAGADLVLGGHIHLPYLTDACARGAGHAAGAVLRAGRHGGVAAGAARLAQFGERGALEAARGRRAARVCRVERWDYELAQVPLRVLARARAAAWGSKTALLRCPAAVHVPRHAAHVVGGRGAEEHGQLAQFLGRGELQRGLLLAQQQLLGFLVAPAVGLGLGVHLLLHQRRQHPARADRVAGHAGGGRLQRRDLGQADDAVLGRDVGGLLAPRPPGRAPRRR